MPKVDQRKLTYFVLHVVELKAATSIIGLIENSQVKFTSQLYSQKFAIFVSKSFLIAVIIRDYLNGNFLDKT